MRNCNCDYVVPPMIIQPLFENAIQHGLKINRVKSGLLSIDIRLVNDYLQYIIADNGIGRAATGKTRGASHRSFGVEISMDRIRVVQWRRNPSVKDRRYLENGIALGTTVTVKLKVQNDVLLS